MFFSELFHVSLHERLDLGRVDLARLVVTDLKQRNSLAQLSFVCDVTAKLRCVCVYLGHGAAQDVLVLVLGDVLLVVVRLQHQLHLLHHALLPVQLLQELQHDSHQPDSLRTRPDKLNKTSSTKRIMLTRGALPTK